MAVKQPSGAAVNKETIMATSTSSNDNGSERRSPVGALTTLLGVYTALYLAVLGAIHFATSPDATAAVVPEVASSHVIATPLPAQPFGSVDGMSGTKIIDAEEPDTTRECTGGVDTSCIYN